jgi:nucleoside-diphosphate-sugar epimerase
MSRLFFTGATGSLAPFLIHRLLHEDSSEPRFVCLLRQAEGESRLRRRIETLCPDCAPKVAQPRFEFVLGDVSAPLPETGPLDAVWHFASDLRMDASSEEAVFATNLAGAKNVLAFCDRTGAALYDISTAYVCGTRAGTVIEEELFCGQEFRNAYEASKAQAEDLVRTWIGNHRGLIFRPSIVLGDTRSGVTLTFQGFYKVLWAVRRLRDRLPGLVGSGGSGKTALTLALPCASPQERVNIVDAEYVTSLLFRIHRDPRALGKTFHLVNPDPPTIQELLDVLAEVIGIEGLHLAPDGRDSSAETDESVRSLVGYLGDQVMVYFSYLAGNHPSFDMTNVADICGGIPPHPKLDRAAWERMFRYALEQDFCAVY